MKKFTKMDGLGNDFVVFLGPITLTSQGVQNLCNRQTGVGADGVIEVIGLEDNLVQMNYWNADGSVAERCGNGLRCAARFAVDNRLVQPGEFTIQSGKDRLKANWDGKDQNLVEVQVGKVKLNSEPIELFGTSFYRASIGNPHAITFVDDIDSAPVETLGPKVEVDRHFAQKTNVDFVEVISPNKLKVRVWERGDGETLACGTGMAVSAFVAVQSKKARFPLEVEVKGGKAKVWQDEEGYMCMMGPAQTTGS